MRVFFMEFLLFFLYSSEPIHSFDYTPTLRPSELCLSLLRVFITKNFQLIWESIVS